MVKVVCWNTNHQKEPWRWLHQMDADVALVQEACDPPSDARDRVDIGPKQLGCSRMEFRVVERSLPQAVRSPDDGREAV